MSLDEKQKTALASYIDATYLDPKHQENLEYIRGLGEAERDVANVALIIETLLDKGVLSLNLVT